MMYSNNYGVPTSYETRVYDGVPYTTMTNTYSTASVPPEGINAEGINAEGERFFLAPFLVGGLAGTALGYGIANNNRPPYPMYPPMFYPTPYPMYTTNYYY